ncbi:MAG: cupin domain-containing protein [Elusimicrobiota bacterium]
MSISAQELIGLYGLLRHPEGGWFRESHRSAGVIPRSVLPAAFAGQRCYSTAVFFLLQKGERSLLHRLASEEIWHFYLGDPLRLVQLGPEGGAETFLLGQDAAAGQKLQHVVPAGTWFGAFPEPGSEYSFVGATVAPGFDFADFELGRREDLLKRFPRASEHIRELTEP